MQVEDPPGEQLDEVNQCKLLAQKASIVFDVYIGEAVQFHADPCFTMISVLHLLSIFRGIWLRHLIAPPMQPDDTP